MKTSHPIPVFAANLPARADRRASIAAQFAGRAEFAFSIVPAVWDKDGAHGLWRTFCGIVARQKAEGCPCFIFCEDDHVFTPDYDSAMLFERIAEADRLGAHLLSGGMSALDIPVQVSGGLFRVRRFTGMQFTVVFSRAYDTILLHRAERHVADIYLSDQLGRIYVTFPYISTQREFGYSDATSANNRPGRVEKLFAGTSSLLRILDKAGRYYRSLERDRIAAAATNQPSDLALPAYAVNLPGRVDRRRHIERQFSGRREFDLRFFPACRGSRGAEGLWQSICRIVAEARDTECDAVLIVEDDHVFTPCYESRRYLRQVVEAGMAGADILLGGISGVGRLVPTGLDGLFWVDKFWCTQFMVVYRRAYGAILQAEFGPADVADEYLSRLLPGKMVIAPFVSEQVDFGYSDVTPGNNRSGRITSHFAEARRRVEAYFALMEDVPGALPVDVRQSDISRNYRLSRGALPAALNVGCGPNPLDGWFNTDLAPAEGVEFMDAASPFPLASASFDYVYSEHLLEHLDYAGARNMLTESFRVLRPGGTLRIALPTLEFLLRLCREPESELSQRYAVWSLSHYAPEMYEDFVRDGQPLPLSLVVNNFMRLWGHRVIYDVPTLFRMLRHAGFRQIAERSVGQSPSAFLSNLERHDTVIPVWANTLETRVVEAVKPET